MRRRDHKHQSRTLTPEEVKERFRARGITLTQWAKDRGYRRTQVYRVLNGTIKAHYGTGHQIAVDLGLKLDPAHSDRNAA